MLFCRYSSTYKFQSFTIISLTDIIFESHLGYQFIDIPIWSVGHYYKYYQDNIDIIRVIGFYVPFYFPIFIDMPNRRYKRQLRHIFKGFYVSPVHLKCRRCNTSLLQIIESQRHGRINMIDQVLGSVCWLMWILLIYRFWSYAPGGMLKKSLMQEQCVTTLIMFLCK